MENVDGVWLHGARILKSEASKEEVHPGLLEGFKGADLRLDIVLELQLVKLVGNVGPIALEDMSNTIQDSLKECHSVCEPQETCWYVGRIHW